MFDALGSLFLQDPNLAAAWGTWLAVVFAAIAVGFTYRTQSRGAVHQALESFTGPELAAARDRLGMLNLRPRVGRGFRQQARHDVFMLLWAVERLSLVRNAAKTALATPETLALYAHVDTVVSTVNNALCELDVDFRDSVIRANTVLQTLPDARSPWRRLRNTAPQQRFIVRVRRCC